jgi:AdoMet-dependent heme synthase
VLTDGAAFSMSDGIGRARNVNDGDGFMFVSHTGEIYPSGFLPMYAGNVRRTTWWTSIAPRRCSRQLRDRSQLKGKCNVCEYLPCAAAAVRAPMRDGRPAGGRAVSARTCRHVTARMVEAGEAEPVDVYFARRARSRGTALPVL